MAQTILSSGTNSILASIPLTTSSVALPLERRNPLALDESGAPEPENSEIRKIANDILQAAQYSFASVAANLDREVRAGSLEATFKDALNRVGAARRENIQAKAVQLVKAPQAVREAIFGRYGQLESEAFISTGFDRTHEGLPPLQIDRKLLGERVARLSIPQGIARATPEGLLIPAANLPGGFEDFEEVIEDSSKKASASNIFDAKKLEEIWGSIYTADSMMVRGGDSEFEEAVTDKLGFYITRVRCVDETNPEWWGSDEIALAGVSVDEDGDTKKIGETYIGGGFDDGDERNYSPSWSYHWFSMQEGKYWPKAYQVGLILAEKDYGGLSSALNTIWQQVKDRVKAAIEQAISSVLAAYLGPALAQAIAKAVAWVVDKLVGWIINAFKDDIFPPFVATCTVPSFNARWNYPDGTWGSTTSNIRTAHFYGHGGHYVVNYYWRLYA